MEHTPEKKQAERTKPISELDQNVRTLATVLAVLILIFTFVVRIIVVSGPSMENTLFNGDAMVVWSLGYKPKQGDVVVLTQPAYQEDSIVKRVIAVGGQTVDITELMGSPWKRTISKNGCTPPPMARETITSPSPRDTCSLWVTTATSLRTAATPPLAPLTNDWSLAAPCWWHSPSTTSDRCKEVEP